MLIGYHQKQLSDTENSSTLILYKLKYYHICCWLHNNNRATSILKEKISSYNSQKFLTSTGNKKTNIFCLHCFRQTVLLIPDHWSFKSFTLWGSKASKVAQGQLASRTSVTNKMVKNRWLQNSKSWKIKSEQRAVNTAQFIKILMIKEENHRWPIDWDADEWSAHKQREARRSLLLTLPAQRAKHCTLWGAEVSAGESRRVKEKRKESLLEESQW